MRTSHRASSECECQPCEDVKSLGRALAKAQEDNRALMAERTRAMMLGTVKGWTAGVEHGLKALTTRKSERDCAPDCKCREYLSIHDIMDEDGGGIDQPDK